MDVDLRGCDVPDPAALRAFLDGQSSLHDVVVAALARNPPLLIADVVVQDEYTHDVVLPWAEGVWLVYDTT